MAGRSTKITKAARAAVLRRDHRQCVQCGSRTALTMDHVIPLSKGGSNGQDNLQALCKRCNRAKGSTEPEFSDLDRKIRQAFGDA